MYSAAMCPVIVTLLPIHGDSTVKRNPTACAVHGYHTVLLSDTSILYCGKATRTFGFGYLSVVIALFLAQAGFSSGQIGALFSDTLLEDAAFTVFVSMLAHRIGAKRILIGSCVLLMLAGLGLGLGRDKWLLASAVVLGLISPAGPEGGPFSSLEQAILPGVTRT